MSELTVADFPAFFKEVHEHEPFAWQTRLLRYLVEHGSWPGNIDAPTGSGKTAVIDVHLFANALRATGWRVPRRLVLTVNRRALVDSQFAYAADLSEHLTGADSGPISARVRKALTTTEAERPFLLTSLRGSSSDAALSRADWRNDPVATQVICATPDMFGSRLLFRGYGTSRAARPIEAGLLAFDTVVVVDEAHLSRQLVTTARRVGELAAATSKVGTPTLQVVATTATQTDAAAQSTVGVTEADLEESLELRRRMLGPKPFTLVEVEDKQRVAVLAEQALQLFDQLGATVGCIVNNVKTAIAVEKAIGKERPKLRRELRVGPMRQYERRGGLNPLDDHSGVVLNREGETIDILIATQTIEVGVDIDLRSIVTELASGSALAQRAGRVNRRGARGDGPVRIIAPTDSRARPPYTESDFKAAHDWLDSLPAESGLAAWNLRGARPPSADPSRPIFQRLEYWDADYLRHTSALLYAESRGADLGLWLRDDLQGTADAGVVVRDRLPSDDNAAVRMIDLMPVHPDEVIPTSLTTLRRALGSCQKNLRAFVLKPDGPVSLAHPGEVGPGETIVVNTDAPLFRSGVVVDEDPDRAPVPDVWRECRDPHEARSLAVTTESNGGGPESLDTRQEAYELLAESEEADTEEERFALICEALEKLGQEVPPNNDNLVTDVHLYDDPQGVKQALLVVKPLRTAVRERDREVATTGREFVLLDTHQRRVAERVARLAAALGLPQQLVKALVEAARVHDEGKRDERFQKLLILIDRTARKQLELDDTFVLAKSRYRSTTKEREFRARQSLTGWRHEQRSAAHAWLTTPPDMDRSLVTRLAGTTHGHGRSSFAHDARTLLPDDATDPELRGAAEELFDVGLWEWVIDETDLEYGIWGCAYLEAVLRAADVQVSAEGS